MLRPARRRHDEPVLPQCRPKHSPASKRLLLRRQLLLAVAALLAALLTLTLALLGRCLVQHKYAELPLRLHADLFAESLWRVAQQQARTPRGIVLPLYDDIALLGFSLILELRALGVDLPIEVPHCADLNDALERQLALLDPLVRIYDVCDHAVGARDAFYSDRKLFCQDREHCEKKFRGFDVKILGVVYSQFEQVMLLDADTLFFQSPMELWNTTKFKETGTLFFHDRITSEYSHLAKNLPGQPEDVRHLHHYLSNFDVGPYQHLPAIPRKPTRVRGDLLPVDLPINPSEFLLSSHSWGLRSGHQMDSSVMLWDKTRQPRATAILASFIALNGVPRPPSYGDKELFFIACELAETEYSFSDYGVGTVGPRLLKGHPEPVSILDIADKEAIQVGPSVLCGDALHYFPVANASRGGAVEPLYINSDDILEWDPATTRLFRTAARRAEFFPGSFKQRGYTQSCPFDVTVVELAPEQAAQFARRQQLHAALAKGRDDLSTWVLALKTEFLRAIDAL